MKKKRKYLALFLIPMVLIIGYVILDRILFDGFTGKEIAEEGFQAKFFCKPDIRNKPAVVLIGGGQGGEYWAHKFAEKGIVSLSLPYYRQSGLPSLMEEIPLEYFEKALNWLRSQPEVNPEKVILMGASRNGELSLVIASTFPELVGGVIAYAPSAVSWSNTVLPFNSDALKASWTYMDQDVPYLPMKKIKGNDSSKIETLEYWREGLKKIDQYEESIIRVEKINGPILLLSGKDDKIWPSAAMSDMIEERLRVHNFQHEFDNVQYENAGHLISRNISSIAEGRQGYMNVDGKSYEFEYGGTIEGDKLAIIKSQEKILSFLQKYESQ